MSDTESPTDDDSSTDPEPTPDVDMEVVDLQRHRNGDETAVAITSFADGYQVLAIEVAHDGYLFDIEQIGSDEDREAAIGMAKYWLQQNPKGIFGGEDGGGVMDSLRDMFGGGAS
jgi:hypothetical protein